MSLLGHVFPAPHWTLTAHLRRPQIWSIWSMIPILQRRCQGGVCTDDECDQGSERKCSPGQYCIVEHTRCFYTVVFWREERWTTTGGSQTAESRRTIFTAWGHIFTVNTETLSLWIQDSGGGWFESKQRKGQCLVCNVLKKLMVKHIFQGKD